MPNTRPTPFVGKLVVVAPGLLALPDAALARSTALARVAALAANPVIEPRGIDAATTAAVEYHGAPAPLAALGAGLDPEDQWVMHADPLRVEIGATDVLAGARVDDLDGDEARGLAADIGELTAAAGVRIAVARPDRWFAFSAASDLAADTLPVDAIVGHGLLGELRRDEGARALARLRGEIEMLLHEHPVNEARRNRGAATVDSLWLWGGGRMPATACGIETCVVDARRGRAGDLARGLAIASHGRVVAPGDAGEWTGITIVVADPLHPESGLDEFGRSILATALARLEAHRTGELVLVADGSGHAATWRARAPRVLERLGLLVRGARFVCP